MELCFSDENTAAGNFGQWLPIPRTLQINLDVSFVREPDYGRIYFYSPTCFITTQ